jgi:arylsulfatase
MNISSMKLIKHSLLFVFMACFFAIMAYTADVQAETKKPNILVIWGDDVGITNISAYSHGLMGYQTPNIDRIANEGALFTDYYAEQSCTAGRSSFITGQLPFRVGLTKVGMPGSKQGLSDEDPTIAELLKPTLSRNRRMSTTRKILNSLQSMGLVMRFIRGQPTHSTRQRTRVSG